MKPWTQEEINSFKRIMDGAPSISEGLSKASQKLHRSKKACSLRLFFLRRDGYVCSKPRKKKTYKDEAKILKEEVKRTPWNLRSAFERTADRVNLTFNTVQAYWYGVGNTKMSKRNIGICFTLKGVSNTKNIIKK